jgi:ferritin-like metal-binding protein YciE
MAGLIREGEQMVKADADQDVRDAGLIAAAQRVEHYEIAGYGTVCTYAKLLGRTNDKDILGRTLDEEKATDEKLTDLATRVVNLDAAA